MKKLLLTTILVLLIGTSESLVLQAQSTDVKPMKTKKEQKAIEEQNAFEKTVDLVNGKQFVFQAVFDPGSDMVFVVVDSAYAEVQSGNRSNLEGKITDFEVRRLEKSKSVSVKVRLRGAMASADVFLFIGPYGDGKATIKSDFPGDFSFDGNLKTFEDANIYEGKSHSIY